MAIFFLFLQNTIPYPAKLDIVPFENSEDPDQRASSEASWSGTTLFSKKSVNEWLVTKMESYTCIELIKNSVKSDFKMVKRDKCIQCLQTEMAPNLKLNLRSRSFKDLQLITWLST